MERVQETPLVSILMPCYKGSNYLRIALDSCLAQTYTNFEVICVDDQSPDDSLAIMHEYGNRDRRIRVIQRATNGGVGRAFQTALDNSRGEYLTRLAHDDRFHPDALRILAEALMTAPEVTLVYGDMEQIDPEGKVLYPIITEEPERALMPRNRVGLYVMWRSKIHQQGVTYAPDMIAEDYDLWLKISLDHKLHKVHAPPQMQFRIHPGQASMKHNEITRSGMLAQLNYHRTLARRHPWQISRHYKVLKGLIRSAIFQLRTRHWLRAKA